MQTKLREFEKQKLFGLNNIYHLPYSSGVNNIYYFPSNISLRKVKINGLIIIKDEFKDLNEMLLKFSPTGF